METLSFQRFRSRVEYLEQHLQVVDLAITLMFKETNAKHGTGNTILQALNVTSTRYEKLRHPVEHDARIFNFSRSRNVEHAVVSLYRHFSEYMHGILAEIYRTNPILVVGKAPGSLQYHEIVALGSFEAIQADLVDKVFRKLENEKSTMKLIEKILSHTGVIITPAVLQTALLYLEIRHLIIHNGGAADAAFVASYSQLYPIAVGDKFPLRARLAMNAIKSVEDMLRELDGKLIAAGFAAARA